MAFFLPLLAMLAGTGAVGAIAHESTRQQGQYTGNPLEQDWQRRNDLEMSLGRGGTDRGIPNPQFQPNNVIQRFNRTGVNPLNALMSNIRNVGNQVTSVASNMGPTTEDILSQLQALQDPSRYMSDPESLRQQAIASASSQYDPLISQLQAQAASAQQRGDQNKKELGQMFGALSNDIQEDIPSIQDQFSSTKNTVKNEYDRLKQSISDQYAQSSKEQEELFKRLNIEAAMPDIAPQQMQDRDFFTNMANTQSQTQQAALGMEERGATEFSRQGSEIAKIEGTQRQANLMEELRNLLGSYESQIGAHQVAKNQAIEASMGQLQQDAMQFAQEQAQREFSNQLQMIQLGRSLRKDQLDSNSATEYPDMVEGPADIAMRALGMGIQPVEAQNLQSIFMDTISNDPLVQTRLDPGTQLALSDEALAKRFEEAGRRAGLSPELLNALQIMALEYYR